MSLHPGFGPPRILAQKLTPPQIASLCDHTFLYREEKYLAAGKSAVHGRREAFESFLEETRQLSERQLQPYAICVRAEHVSAARQYFDEHNLGALKIAATAGFPDPGLYTVEDKLHEIRRALAAGATEIDLPIDRDLLHAHDAHAVARELRLLRETIHKAGGLLKIILETSELSAEQIILACSLADMTGADFVKTSTGYTATGATPDALSLMRAHFPRGVKASGGVTPHTVRDLLGATERDGYVPLDPLRVRIGESSLLKSYLSDASEPGTY